MKEEAWDPFWGTFNLLLSCFVFREKSIREIPFNTRADPEAADVTKVEERFTES